LPHSPLGCSDPLLGQRALSRSRSLYFQCHYMSSCLSFYSGFHNSPEGPQYQRIRQGDIRHAPKTRNIAPIKFLNPSRVENQPPNR
jgi:hypothetical protein